MTGSSSNKSTGTHSSLSIVERKTIEQMKEADSSTFVDAKEECKVTGLKEPCTTKKLADDGREGPLDVIDEETDANCTSPKIVNQEEQVIKLPIKSPVDNSEELAICLYSDDSDHTKIADPLSEGKAKPDKKNTKDVAKSAKLTKLTKSPDTFTIKNKMIWVYNILPSTKASELKIHFSKHAKITTARVVTNGRNYYGCLTVDDEESVKECVKQLNNTIMDGQEIKVQSNAPDNDNESTAEQQKRSNNNDNKKVLPLEKRSTSVNKSVRSLRRTDRMAEKADPLTLVVKSPKRNRSKSKEAQQEHTQSKRRRSRSNSLELETRKKMIELRRLTADIEEMQRRKERMIAEEKEKERVRRENERIQEMRRKIEEERAHKRMEIELANKRLDVERKLLEKERDAFMKLKTIQMEEMRIRTETKHKIEEAEEYQRSLTRKVSSKERGDRKRSSASPKRYQENFNDAATPKQCNRNNNNRSRSPNLYLNSQKFDIKPLKREINNDKYPPPPKISSSSTYNQRLGNKSSSEQNHYYNSKENRYNTNNPNSNKYANCANTSPLPKKINQTKPPNNNSSWLPSALSTSSNYRQQQQQQPLSHHHGGQATINIPWQQISNGNSSSKQLGTTRYNSGTGASVHEQQQYHHHNHHGGGGIRHPVQYPGQMVVDGALGGSGKGGGRMQGGGYQGGRRY